MKIWDRIMGRNTENGKAAPAEEVCRCTGSVCTCDAELAATSGRPSASLIIADFSKTMSHSSEKLRAISDKADRMSVPPPLPMAVED